MMKNYLKFGNWVITQDAIIWEKEGDCDYEIPIASLTDRRGTDRSIYDWLVHMPEKTWMTREDTYALNTAFMYVMFENKISFPDDMSLPHTLSQQDAILDLKDNPVSMEDRMREMKKEIL